MNYLDKYSIPEFQSLSLSEVKQLIKTSEQKIKPLTTLLLVLTLLPAFVFGKHIISWFAVESSDYVTLTYIALVLFVHTFVYGPLATLFLRREVQRQVGQVSH